MARVKGLSGIKPVSGVRFDILAFNLVFWRSPRYSGVQLDFLAFALIFWRSTIIWRLLNSIHSREPT
ncbi:hypothetical protein [Sporosarcina sp. NCCP-2222]|uniref:hypothetical protein n=1 Tax=Sporosarcina sp. NCCP-2222 TaxID=2935073 RepID=UPI0020BDF5BF|nr:hypothetical protein [Sporosarcina sp. NCCP-2222]